MTTNDKQKDQMPADEFAESVGWSCLNTLQDKHSSPRCEKGATQCQGSSVWSKLACVGRYAALAFEGRTDGAPFGFKHIDPPLH